MVRVNTQYRDLEVLENEKAYDLLQLRKAISEERYEVCSFWSRMARRNGATRPEISWQISVVLSGDEIKISA